jgi:anti-sigma factor RsiW
MSRRRLEQQVGAYRDGALSPRQADQLRQRLETDPEARLELARHEALGRLAREAWREGPAAPSPELLIASLRSGLRQIDAELEESRPARWRGWLAPVPLVAIGSAAALLAFALAKPGDPAASPSPAAAPFTARAQAQSVPSAAAQPVAATTSDEREIPVYDLAQGASPLMLFEDQGTTYIWLIQPDKLGDDVSALPGGWV